jgi:hypothetical protein
LSYSPEPIGINKPAFSGKARTQVQEPMMPRSAHPNESPTIAQPAPPPRPRRGFGRLWLVGWLLIGTALLWKAAPQTTEAPASDLHLADRHATFGPALAPPSRQLQPPTTLPIEQLDLGRRVAGRNPLREQVVPNAPEPNPVTWRRLVIRMNKENGGPLHIHLLRELAWIKAVGAIEGQSFFLDLPEMGAVGDAYVISVGPCPEIKRGRGNVITGTFRHEADSNQKILRVEFSNGAVIQGVTDNHPFYSADRHEYVAIGEMHEGDTVQIRNGLARITRIESRLPSPGEMIYNLETHNEHVYTVTEFGILTHNFCAYRTRFDSQGRIRSVFAHITQNDLYSGSATNAATRKAAQMAGHASDDAGHLIGKLLGGPGGKKANNFFAQNPHINRGAFRDFEASIATEVAAGRQVHVRVSLKYRGTSTRPYEVHYQVRVDGVSWEPMIFGN